MMFCVSPQSLQANRPTGTARLALKKTTNIRRQTNFSVENSSLTLTSTGQKLQNLALVYRVEFNGWCHWGTRYHDQTGGISLLSIIWVPRHLSLSFPPPTRAWVKLITTAGLTLITKCSRFSSFNYKGVFISNGQSETPIINSQPPHLHVRTSSSPPPSHPPTKKSGRTPRPFSRSSSLRL